MLWIIWRQHNDWVFDPSSMAFGKDIPNGVGLLARLWEIKVARDSP